MKLEKRIQKLPPIKQFQKHPYLKIFQTYWWFSKLDNWVFLAFVPMMLALGITYWLLKIKAIYELTLILLIIIITSLALHFGVKILHKATGFPELPEEQEVSKHVLSIKLSETGYFTTRDLAKALYTEKWKILPAEEKRRALNWANKVLSHLKQAENVKIEEHPFEEDVQIILSP